ncbi:MAG: hypothetical protein HKN82_06480, partial [Akkermansiaceae bacterium]|nr:hypothetical protein [Akkermansiaceae bacterium]
APDRPSLTTAEQAALKRVQASGLQLTRRTGRPRATSRVRDLLSSPASTRDAIVLREILGPPKGME